MEGAELASKNAGTAKANANALRAATDKWEKEHPQK
jgi:hypothetical protein